MALVWNFARLNPQGIIIKRIDAAVVLHEIEACSFSE
jgi:hypothetical protein